ncbi:hypothetical protein HYW54_01210 [Candidatus Gottesmanbacteria bacterium]|nr:hypothetical protein [Candidatus Gottesmanbacteria bacterium]
MVKGFESIKENNFGIDKNIIRVIPNWRIFFDEHRDILFTRCGIYAHGGTIDSYPDVNGELEPLFHSVSIESTDGQSASQIARRFGDERIVASTLGEQYKWSHDQQDIVPWVNIVVKEVARCSGFDSGQEEEPHFAAGTKFNYELLRIIDLLGKSKGTDSQIDQGNLDAIVLLQFLLKNNKQIAYFGSPEPGIKPNSLAIPNITGGLYALLESELPPNVYIITSKRLEDKTIITEILPGLGSVKLHSDGFFYSPNSEPLLTIINGVVYKHELLDKLKQRIQYAHLVPDLSEIYLQNDESVDRLQKALELVSLETVKNPARQLEEHYKDGMRAFVIKARGSGNGPLKWRKAIEDILAKGDTTVMIITLADSGDVDLKKYKAGLYVEGVLSGRTLREDAACILAGIIHDLKKHNQLNVDPQKMIELFCYLSGMIDLSSPTPTP